ncbi:hypothetical protein DPEC_G00207800 [Dallia pectoralis]|uniref:Uncharacterized protein n=1 Tax=Dallia pectoralis TaxID=75939 RepID=A0ACC2G4Y7_DALPE|nr:hypothetical protein DPEC_G00207800 [Dallia pectoralis]
MLSPLSYLGHSPPSVRGNPKLRGKPTSYKPTSYKPTEQSAMYTYWKAFILYMGGDSPGTLPTRKMEPLPRGPGHASIRTPSCGLRGIARQWNIQSPISGLVPRTLVRNPPTRPLGLYLSDCLESGTVAAAVVVLQCQTAINPLPGRQHPSPLGTCLTRGILPSPDPSPECVQQGCGFVRLRSMSPQRAPSKEEAV